MNSNTHAHKYKGILYIGFNDVFDYELINHLSYSSSNAIITTDIFIKQADKYGSLAIRNTWL
jgi:hypothetical protein